MMIFCWIERLQRHNLRHDRSTEHLGVAQLLDVRLRNSLLLCAGVEDRGPVLRAAIGPLPVELSWIVCDVQKYFQDLPVRNLLWIEGHLDGCVANFRGP
jgi:hypothetical protein